MKNILKVLSIFMFCYSTAFAFDAPNATVKELKTNKFADKSNAIVKGTLVRQIDKDDFIFTDGTDEIQIEIDDSLWKAFNWKGASEKPFYPPSNTEMTVRVSVDKAFAKKVEIEALEILDINTN